MGFPELKLIQDVTTRWNSTFDMFQRCILIKEPLISTITIIGNVDNCNTIVTYLSPLKKQLFNLVLKKAFQFLKS